MDGRIDPREPTGSAAGRRHIAVLFCDLCDSTGIAATLELEDYEDLLASLRAAFAKAAADHGGEIVRIDGDGATVVFGHRIARDDDARRAVEAALDMHAAARALWRGAFGDVRPRLHSGVHAGLALVRPGDLVRGRFEILGDATNVAARLCDHAGADQVLASESGLAGDLHFFRFGERRLVAVAGRQDPVAVRPVLGRAATGSRYDARVRRGVAPFHGRGPELAWLEARLARAAGGERLLAVATGEPGLGKSRLASEFLRRAEAAGATVLRGFCESYTAARPLQPFLAMLAAGGDRNPRSSEGGRDVGAVERALAERLREGRPAVLFVDDWQWADDASRALFDRLRARGPPHLALLASRVFDPLDARLARAEVLALAPLAETEAEAVAAALLPLAEPFAAARVARAAGGNPLLVEELCHARRVGQSAEGVGLAGPWLRKLIGARFLRLPEKSARLLQTAAVIGEHVAAPLFQRITGAGLDDPRFADLADSDFLYVDHEVGALAFKHGVAREAVLELTPAPERRALHEAVCRALREGSPIEGAGEPLDALAHHLRGAGRFAEAAIYAERAGDAAMAARSLDLAQARYRAGLEALEADEAKGASVADERWSALARKYAEASLFDPAREQLPILARASERAAAGENSGAFAWAEYWLGCLHYGLGDGRAAIRHCQRALPPALSLGDSRLIVQLRATLGEARGATCDYGEAIALLDAAIALKRRHRSRGGTPAGLAYALSCRAFVLADEGRFAEAYDGFDEALGLLGGEVHQLAASVFAQRSAACLWHGRMDEAAACAAEAGRVAERVRARYLFAMAQALGAYAHWSERGDRTSLAAMIEATRWLEASQSGQFLSLNHGWLSEAMAATGDIAAARRHGALALTTSARRRSAGRGHGLPRHGARRGARRSRRGEALARPR